MYYTRYNLAFLIFIYLPPPLFFGLLWFQKMYMHVLFFTIWTGYKTHTDCMEDSDEKRDRFATILVYLQDVEDGGETKFPGM